VPFAIHLENLRTYAVTAKPYLTYLRRVVSEVKTDAAAKLSLREKEEKRS
jgi:hypothetical protein